MLSAEPETTVPRNAAHAAHAAEVVLSLPSSSAVAGDQVQIPRRFTAPSPSRGEDQISACARRFVFIVLLLCISDVNSLSEETVVGDRHDAVLPEMLT